ncbi:MAG: PD-(D/E)XK nuclease family protein [Lachnospiraceae bacterium]|nr:PD-(D/E)XK nuclease family protein [Lachnospiraceae bacterium]
MEPFLSRIAKAYIESERKELLDYCFVFPNKRSVTFFRHYLELHNRSGIPLIEPKATTISDFISEFSDYTEAPRYDVLFTMYDEYRKIFQGLSSESTMEDFDRFVFWGDMLISDFNDVDRYLVEPAELFRNVKDLREISSDFLTDEQKDIIKKYWDIDLGESDPESFWKHLTKKEEMGVTRNTFIKLWEILLPLFNATKNSLACRGLIMQGAQYREVADKLKKLSAEDILYSRIIFVGFNVLSSSELCIFERLNNLGIADFYWDFDFPEPLRKLSSPARFLKNYVKRFPSIYDIKPASVPTPEIEIIGVPSNIGQVKLIGRMLKQKSRIKSYSSVDTAIVLPSESLFIDLLHSVPPEIGPVNITMGYPLKMTSIASLMRNVMSMHLRAKKVRDRWCYFHEDVTAILNHHLVKQFAEEECREICDNISRRRLFTIPADDIREKYPSLQSIFFPVDDLKKGMQVFDYALNLADDLQQKLSGIAEQGGEMEIESGFLTRYRLSIEQLRNAVVKYGIIMHENTFFHMIERAVSGESVNFVGEPLSGLQIMGVLETRALDFNNIIMPSMNERVFPRKHYSRSFIPNVLRRSFGLSTTEFQESIFAYYFYRLISKAKKVTLLYDARTSGLKGGEMSRYLYQLVYLYPADKLRVRQAFYDVPPVGDSKFFEIKKTPEILSKINCFLSDAPQKRYLSPSAINQYLSCPMQFYFSRVERIATKEEMNDYMDESIFGSIVHKVAELCYKQLRGKEKEIYIDAEALDRIKKEHTTLERTVTSTINQLYNNLRSEGAENEPYINLTELQGEAHVLGQIIIDFILKLFDREKEQPFYFIEGEKEFRTQLPLGDGRYFNIMGSIDRVDRIINAETGESLTRIIDYKTGSDSINVKKIDDLFSAPTSSDGHNKAVLQLFLYCFAYNHDSHSNEAIMPMIYLFRKLYTESISPVTIEGSPLMDYREYAEKVNEELLCRLRGLFDSNVPFSPQPHSSHCKYCEFKSVCGLAIEQR